MSAGTSASDGPPSRAHWSAARSVSLALVAATVGVSLLMAVLVTGLALRSFRVLAPRRAGSSLELGALYRLLGQPQEALPRLELAARALPDDGRACFEYGAILFQLDRAPEAAEQFRQATRLLPDSVEAYAMAGDSFAAAASRHATRQKIGPEPPRARLAEH